MHLFVADLCRENVTLERKRMHLIALANVKEIVLMPVTTMLIYEYACVNISKFTKLTLD